MHLPCTVHLFARLVAPPDWDWSSGVTPPVELALEWPTDAAPAPGLAARVQQLSDWTRAFTAQRRGIYLHAITIESLDPPRLEVLILRDDIDGAEDETAAARRAARALAREQPALAAGVRFRGEYCK